MISKNNKTLYILQNISSKVLIIIFLYVITIVTHLQYTKTEDHPVINPEVIITGKSQAPNQYRILPTLFYMLFKKITHNLDKADTFVQFLSIFICYAACAYLFYYTTKSIGVSLFSLLALFGTFISGFQMKYRQEFFETGLMALLFLQFIRTRISLITIIVLTLFGSLNRETWIFGLISIFLVRLHYFGSLKVFLQYKRDFYGLMLAFAIFGIIQGGVRIFFGYTPYHCSFWMLKHNIVQLLTFPYIGGNNYSVYTMGSGVVWLYIISFMKGNQFFLIPIITYCIPLFLVSFYISSWGEHRVFYPVYPLLIISLTKYFLSSYCEKSK